MRERYLYLTFHLITTYLSIPHFFINLIFFGIHSLGIPPCLLPYYIIRRRRMCVDKRSNFWQPTVWFVMMSIAVDHRNEGRINRSGLMFGVACCMSSGYDHSTHDASATPRGRRDGLDSCTSSPSSSPSSPSSPSSSSSIGMNSDASPATSLAGGDAADAGTEVQSSFKDPFDTMDALHQALPLKRGISMFYSGKSKSFTSLGDAFSVLSATSLAKPRKNLIISGSSSSSYSSWLRSSSGGISKRTAGLSRKRVIT